MTLALVLAAIIILALGINLHNAQQEVKELTEVKDELEDDIYSLKRKNISLQVELSELKLMQITDRVKIPLAWQYLYYSAKQEHLDKFIESIKDDFDDYLVKMKRINKANRSYLEVTPIDCTRYLHSIIDEYKKWKQGLLELEEA